MIMDPPEGSILIAQMVIKLGLSTTKIKYLTGIYMISQNFYHLCFAASNVGPIKIRTSPSTTTKADLLFLFVNEMK